MMRLFFVWGVSIRVFLCVCVMWLMIVRLSFVLL